MCVYKYIHKYGFIFLKIVSFVMQTILRRVYRQFHPIITSFNSLSLDEMYVCSALAYNCQLKYTSIWWIHFLAVTILLLCSDLLLFGRISLSMMKLNRNLSQIHIGWLSALIILMYKGHLFNLCLTAALPFQQS